jgi:signal transduction histidine kinase
MGDGPPPGQDCATAQDAWTVHLHDLRTPLTVVVGRVQLLRRRLHRGQAPLDLDGDLQAIEAALARLTAAIERLDRSQKDWP